MYDRPSDATDAGNVAENHSLDAMHSIPDLSTRAFLPYPTAARECTAHAGQGTLRGLTFAVKDLFDVAGYPTGAGNPHVLVRSGIKTAHAPPVAALLDAGAQFVGKTVTDEMAFSGRGNNAHFGIPINGAAPDRITGGSSSGSASAVSNGQCDIALGSDTGGSVRGPANHCGLYGMRPSFGRISLQGCFPLCATFDTCGFFARDAATFERAAAVLLGTDSRPLPATPRVLIAEDLFALLSPEVQAALQPAVAAIEAKWGKATPVNACGEASDSPAQLYQAYRVLQGWEAWQMQGERIERDGLCLGADIAARFEYARAVTEVEAAEASLLRDAFTAHLSALLGDDAILISPTQPDIAPLRDSTPEALAAFESYRIVATHLMALAPMGGGPQVSVPFAGRLGAPLGLSLMSKGGSDLSLVRALAGLTVPNTAIRAPHVDKLSASSVDQAATAIAAVREGVREGTQVGKNALATGPLAPEPSSPSDTERAALAWYAQTMAGAPIQAEDLEAVVALSLPVAHAVQRAALRDLQWTDVTQSLGPQLRQWASADGSTR